MNYTSRYQATMPTVLPYLHLEGYILMRQSFQDPAIAESIDDIYNSSYLADIAIAGIDRQAKALVEPLGAAAKSGISVLRFEGEQSLVTSTEFRTKLQGYLREQYQTATDNTTQEGRFIPPFPFAYRLVMSSLINGPHGKKAIEQVRRMIVAEETPVAIS